MEENTTKTIFKMQLNVIKRLNNEFEQWRRGDLDFGFDAQVVHWELLKPSGDSWNMIARHYENLQRNNNKRYEVERINPTLTIQTKNKENTSISAV